MQVSRQQLEDWLQAPEDEHLEFKEAKNRFDFEKLVRYCAALANEGGGWMVLGVADQRPREVVGTVAFPDLERTRTGLVERLQLKIQAHSIDYNAARVVIFTVPSRPQGVPVHYKGAYWMRSGDALLPMTQDQLRAIFSESSPDFSEEVCAAATLDDLAPEAIGRFREMWQKKSGNPALANLEVLRLLEDAELVLEGAVTYAALVLLGTRKALGRHLAQAEVVFEYRSSEKRIPFQQREEYRKGFLLFHDELWEKINLRNEIHSYQDGFALWDILTFNEAAVREAILNAVSHRDYRHPGSTFVRQWPGKIEIVSPGGFPDGVSSENILWRQNPRNRRIAETLARCGLVERAGQGADEIVRRCILEGKLPPDYSDSDAYQISLVLDGRVRDDLFVLFLDYAGKETDLDADDLLLLDAVHRGIAVPECLQGGVASLCERDVLEHHGDGLVLSGRLKKIVRGRNGGDRRQFEDDVRPETAPSRQTGVSPEAEDRRIEELDRYLGEGYRLFGLIGYPGSGKTCFLKAVNRILAQQGHVFSGLEWRQTELPAPTGAAALDYVICSGPERAKWIFIDVGGNLYSRMSDADWGEKSYDRKLLHYLHRCSGLFLFLHLEQSLFDFSEDRRDEKESDRHEADDRWNEIDFFDSVLLFLRTLRFEGGDLQKVLHMCGGRSPTKALINYRSTAPLLDIPVMFFLTKADKYARDRVKVSHDYFLIPSELSQSCGPFVARHLPTLFSSLLGHVRHFKFDFIQSFEETPSKPYDVRWESEGEPTSVGALAGLQFVLSHLPGRLRWPAPRINTRWALKLHRILHKRQWKGVLLDL